MERRHSTPQANCRVDKTAAATGPTSAKAAATTAATAAKPAATAARAAPTAAAAAPTAATATAAAAAAANESVALYERLRKNCLNARSVQNAKAMLLYAELLLSLAHPYRGIAEETSSGVAAEIAQHLRQNNVFSVCCCSGDPAAAAHATAAAADATAAAADAAAAAAANAVGETPGGTIKTSSSSSNSSSSSSSSRSSRSRCLHLDSLRLFGEALLRSGCLERLLQQLLQQHRPWTLQDPQLLLLAATAHMDSGSCEGLSACRALLEKTKNIWRHSSLAHTIQVLLGEALDRLGCAADALKELQAAFLLNPIRPKLLFLLFGSGVLTLQQEAALLAAADYSRCSWALHLPIALASAAARITPLEFLALVRQQRMQQLQQQQQQQQQEDMSTEQEDVVGKQQQDDQGLLLLTKWEQQLQQLQQQQQQEKQQQRFESAAIAAVATRYPTPLLPHISMFSHVSLSVQAIALHAERNIPLAFDVASMALEVLSDGLYAAPVFISCCMQLGRAADLLGLLQRLKQEVSMESLRYYAEGVFLMMQTQYAEAVACFRRSLSRSGGALSTLVWGACNGCLGHCLSALGFQQQAAAAYEETARALPGDPLALVLFALEFDPQGVSSLSLRCLQHAHTLRPRDPRVCFELSLAKLKCNNVCDALPLARAAVAAAEGRPFAFARALVSVHLARCLLRKAVLPSSRDEEYLLLLQEAHQLLQQQLDAAACRCRDSSSNTCCNGCCSDTQKLLRACRFLMGASQELPPRASFEQTAQGAAAAAAAPDAVL